MKNKKIVSGLIMAAVATTSIGATFAADSINNSGMTNTNNMRLFNKNNLSQEQKAEMDAIKEIMIKQRNGKNLTTEEQTKLDEFQSKKIILKERGFGEKRGFGGKFMNNLTDEERSQLENMTDIEKQAFFEKKREEFQAKMMAQENVIDKILAGQSLTSEEEKIKQEIITQRAEIKAEREKRQADREAMKLIFTKLQNGKILTTEEQTKLNEFRQNGKSRGKIR